MTDTYTLQARLGGEFAAPELVLERFMTPGAGIAVIRDRALAWSCGYGRRSADVDAPVGETTRFQAGSISKSVAALCALRLVARGELELDEDVNATLRSWKLRAGSDWQPRVTLRQLLTHCGGINAGAYPGYERGSRMPTLVEALEGGGGANTPPVRVTGLPGGGHAYSGGGYAVLQQLLIDHVGGEFADLARDLVLKPLGMDHTGYEQDLDEVTASEAVDGHRCNGRPVAGGSFVYPESAAAGMWTTAADLARFLSALQRARIGERDGILPTELAAEMTSDVTGAEYGLGLRLFPHAGGALFGHRGDSQGFVAQAFASLDGGYGAVVMTNSDFGWYVIKALQDGIAEIEGWPNSPQAGDGQLPQGCAGAYRLDDGRVAEVSEHDGRAVLGFDDQAPLDLTPTVDGAWRGDPLNVVVEFDPVGASASPAITIWHRPDQVETMCLRGSRISEGAGR